MTTKPEDEIDVLSVDIMMDTFLYQPGSVFSLKSLGYPRRGLDKPRTAVINLINILQGGNRSCPPVSRTGKSKFILLATKKGYQKASLDKFKNIT